MQSRSVWQTNAGNNQVNTFHRKRLKLRLFRFEAVVYAHLIAVATRTASAPSPSLPRPETGLKGWRASPQSTYTQSRRVTRSAWTQPRPQQQVCGPSTQPPPLGSNRRTTAALSSRLPNNAGLAWDRQWMVVDAATNKFLTQRQEPRLAVVRAHAPAFLSDSASLFPGWPLPETPTHPLPLTPPLLHQKLMP